MCWLRRTEQRLWEDTILLLNLKDWERQTVPSTRANNSFVRPSSLFSASDAGLRWAFFLETLDSASRFYRWRLKKYYVPPWYFIVSCRKHAKLFYKKKRKCNERAGQLGRVLLGDLLLLKIVPSFEIVEYLFDSCLSLVMC